MSEIEPRLTAATLDGPCRVTVRLNRRVHVPEWARSRFCLKTSDGQEIALRSVEPIGPRHDQATTFQVETVEPLDFVHHLFEIWVSGAGSRLVSVRDVLLDPEQYHSPEARLGANWMPEATEFRVFAPTAAGVEVVLADELVGDRGLAAHDMRPAGKGVWEARVEGNCAGRYYAYRLRGVGFNPRQDVGDVYARCTQGLFPRSLVVDMSSTDPPGFREHSYVNPPSPVDAIVYEMHVRDFTIAPESGISCRGKFLGLAEGGTRLAGEPNVVTGLDHLVELGVTHVQLMPVQDFDNREGPDDEYNWGYMPVQFNSPDGWYATSRTGPVRIRELKQAIQAFHERGIGVVLDVVYNHTAKPSPFERLVPHYYYRKTPADRFHNGSGCGNEFMSEAPMARKFILDSLKMWLQEYRVDGFRFDLMGLFDVETMRQIKSQLTAIRPDVLLWGEPWTGGSTPLRPISDKHQLRGMGIGCFSDSFRDAIKGERDEGHGGFIQFGERAEAIRHGLQASIRDWAAEPGECVNYFECHDNLTSWDKLVQTMPEAGEEDLQRVARLGALLLLTAQGVAFLHSGQEFGRTKRGHHNSYNLPDEINRIDWRLKKRRALLYNYYRGLIALRKAHPVLRLRTRGDIEYRVWFGNTPHDRAIAHIVHAADYPGEPSQAIIMLYNGSGQWLDFQLGEGTWSIYADGDRAGLEPLGTIERQISLPPRSGAMLCR